MTLVEDQLERFFGHGFDAPDADAGIAAVGALAACDLLSDERAAVWRERFERARRPRPPVDPILRARCLALLELLGADDDNGGPLSALPTHLSEAGLIASSDYHDAIESERRTPPVAVALGPPPAPAGLHVVWIATYADDIELAVRDLSLDAEPDRIVLRSSDGTTHRGGGYISNNRSHMRFYPRPTTPSSRPRRRERARDA